jgi:hypothetical protein
MTRDKYLDLAYVGDPPNELVPRRRRNLPPQFQELVPLSVGEPTKHLPGQGPKPVAQDDYPQTAAPWIDPAQDLVASPKEKSGFENYFECHA